MPAVFASPFATDQPGQTRYKAFVGEGAAFERGPDDAVDRLHRRHVEHDPDRRRRQAVIWTKPDDVEFTGTADPSVLALPNQTGCNVVHGRRLGAVGRVGPADPGEAEGRDHARGGEVIGLDN